MAPNSRALSRVKFAIACESNRIGEGNMRKAWLIAAALACPPIPVIAIAAENEATTDEAKKDPMVCRTDRATGSRVQVRRVCMRRSEWTELQREVRKSMDSISTNNNMGNRGPEIIGAGGPQPQ